MFLTVYEFKEIDETEGTEPIKPFRNSIIVIDGKSYKQISNCVFFYEWNNLFSFLAKDTLPSNFLPDPVSPDIINGKFNIHLTDFECDSFMKLIFFL